MKCTNCGMEYASQTEKYLHGYESRVCSDCMKLIRDIYPDFKPKPALVAKLEERRKAGGFYEARKAKVQRMFCNSSMDHYNHQMFMHISKDPRMVKMYDDESDIYEVEVSMSPNQTPEKRTSGFGIDYWAWIDANSDDFDFVQPSWPSFSIQFAGGGDAEMKLGRGIIYRVQLKIVRKVEANDS